VKVFLTLLFSIGLFSLLAQTDTTRVLDEVEVHAYSHDRALHDIPAAIAKISIADLQRFGNTNILPALNTQPGVRMEERSPGSYRLSIRGSTLRSPFGVRNVKVYYNGLPLTDYGGNTYINLLDFGSVDNLEVIKGPGSSLYGAGTGGVLIVNKKAPTQNQFTVEALSGSFDLWRGRLGADFKLKKGYFSVNFAQQESDGYREHSAMSRKVFAVRAGFELSKKTSLSLNFVHSNLFYQTPGGLNKAQYDADPTQARPRVVVPTTNGGFFIFPGAVDKKAAIYNNTSFGGITVGQDWTKDISSTLAVFGNITDFKNPAIQNYEKRDEEGWGFRNENQWKHANRKLMFGAEFQQGRSLIDVGGNNQGTYVDAGNSVRLPSSILVLFAQYDWQLPNDFFLTAGASVNRLQLNFENSTEKLERTLGPIFSPRIALLKKLNAGFSAYGSFSRGYSPPTTAEVFPSTAIYNPNLKPEFGNNYEAGLKTSLPWLEGSLAVYSFQLDQTIIRLDSLGQDYFTNSGLTSQNGIELYVRFKPQNGLFSGWISYSYNRYRFKENIRDGVDYSGNNLTGVAPHIASAGLDFKLKGFSANLTMNYVHRLPLNDANTDFAPEYFIAGLRLSYQINKSFQFFGGGDNLFDEQYSLGHDINARAGRYYNAAPGRNFYGGVKAKLGW
jgi:iron complex outermembrane recepter protein